MTNQTNSSDAFQELNLAEIRVHSKTWAKRFNQIERVDIHRGNADTGHKYALVVTTSPSAPSIQDYRNWVFPGCMHIQDDLSEFYKKDQVPQNYFDEWIWWDIEPGEDVPSEFILKDERVNIYERKTTEKKLTYRDEQQTKCREFAAQIWNKDPQVTIADMIFRDELAPYTVNKKGDMYTEKTIRNWIKDLCPNRSQGRRSIKK